jgi:hypothetical protein
LPEQPRFTAIWTNLTAIWIDLSAIWTDLSAIRDSSFSILPANELNFVAQAPRAQSYPGGPQPPLRGRLENPQRRMRAPGQGLMR